MCDACAPLSEATEQRIRAVKHSEQMKERARLLSMKYETRHIKPEPWMKDLLGHMEYGPMDELEKLQKQMEELLKSL